MNMTAQILGGIGLFLLGMISMTEGLKAMAGDGLRTLLARFVRGPWSGVACGALLTAAVQSSSATTLTVIGFVSAGLLTFPRAVGVIVGANLGTTSTGWLVSQLGFKVSVGAAAMPLVFVGAMLRLLGRERIASLGTALSGFGLIFVGLDLLQNGMGGLAAQVTPADLPGTDLGGRLLLVGVGLVMTVVMQSSSAAVATTLAALHTGTVSLEQAAALVVGQNIGTTITAGLSAIGASVPARRTALAHAAFNIVAALVAVAALPWFVAGTRWLGARIGGAGPATMLAAFHTAFNALGLLLVMPALRPFCRLIEWVIPARGPILTRFLDPTVVRIGPVAVEAARRTVIECAAVAVDAAVGRLSLGPPGRAPDLAAVREALHEVRGFLAQVARGAQGHDEARRHLGVLHAVDHAARLVEAVGEVRPVRARLAQAAVQALTQAAAVELVAVRKMLADPAGAWSVDAVAAASRAIADLRREHRATALAETAAGRFDAVNVSEVIEALHWIDRLAYHAWRAVHHLQPELPAQSEPHVRPERESQPAD